MAFDSKKRTSDGFSLLELLVAMTITLILLGIASSILSGALGIRERESEQTDALVSAQIVLTSMSREIANSGFGLSENGIVLADSNQQRLHIRANIKNNDTLTDDKGEDITYFYDPGTKAIIRYDRFDNQQTSIMVKQVSNLTFQYIDYTGLLTNPVIKNSPSANTGRVRIAITVWMDDAPNQPNNRTMTLISDVTLRNSSFMLNRY